MTIIDIILVVIIIILSVGFFLKKSYETNEEIAYRQKIEELKIQQNVLQSELTWQQENLKNSQSMIDSLNDTYNDKAAQLKQDLEDQKQERLKQLDEYIEAETALKKKEFDEVLADTIKEYNNLAENYKKAANDILTELNEKVQQTEKDTQLAQDKFNALLAPLKKYEADQMQKRYYTIQVPEEYQKDIEYLLTNVTNKIQHPDIISKLIWSEYIKPYIEDTIKRAEIKEESGIYKITNINNGKSYIGKSTNIKKRIQDHFKSSIGISSIADQYVHHEILKEGIWNWLIEPIIYCDKDKLNMLEKYYINFFHTQEFGYNRKDGG